MKRIKMCGAVAALLACGLAMPVFAQSDISARYETGEERLGAFGAIEMEMTIEVSGEGHVRMQMHGMPAYYLYRDEIMYVIQRTPDGPYVVRASDLINVQMEFAQEMFGEDFTNEFAGVEDEPVEINYVSMGTETVNGRAGTAYAMQGEDEAAPLRAQIVISNDTELAPLGLAIQRANAGMTRDIGGPFANIGRVLNEMNAIMSEGAPLRMSVLELTDVSTDDILDARFMLPAEPLTVEQLRASLVPFDPPPTLPPRSE